MITLEKEEDEGIELKSDDTKVVLEGKEMELTLYSNSMSGFHNQETMKFFEKTGSRKVLILLNIRATHSFISRILVEKLGLPMVPTKFTVTLDDARKVKRMGRCQQVELKF